MKKHLIIRLFGKVQGINFRWSTRKRAKSLGVSGYVQNLDDGSVIIEAEADDSTLHKLKEWCKSGPMFSRVDKMEINEAPLRNLEQFVIKYG